MRNYKHLIFICLFLWSPCFLLSKISANQQQLAYHSHNSIMPATIAPLFNSKAKLIANYSPILALRGLAHGKLYRKKGTAHMERYYYEGDAKTPYQKTLLNITVSSSKWNDRIIEAKGTINTHKVIYKNIMELSLPRKARMNVYCNIGAYNLLSLFVDSDGTALTNNVLGYYAGKSVEYFTKHRTTEGILAGSNYKMLVEGIVNPKTKLLELSNKGTFDEVKINGSGGECADGHFEFIEHFDNITVKTYLHITEN